MLMVGDEILFECKVCGKWGWHLFSMNEWGHFILTCGRCKQVRDAGLKSRKLEQELSRTKRGSRQAHLILRTLAKDVDP
jgi:hypothetical protein